MLADAVGWIDLVIGQNHQTELVGQFADGGAVEVRLVHLAGTGDSVQAGEPSLICHSPLESEFWCS
jgi:hypothetical protein